MPSGKSGSDWAENFSIGLFRKYYVFASIIIVQY
jgi:hypothetical protein